MSTLTNVVYAFDACWNRHDTEAIIASFTEDAIIQPIPPLPGGPDVYRGKAEIRDFVAALITGFHVDSKNHEATGERVRWYADISNDAFRAMNIQALGTDCEIVVRDGKILSFVPRFTEESVAKLAAAMSQA